MWCEMQHIITPNKFGKQYNMPLGNPMWTKSSVNWPLATTVIKSNATKKGNQNKQNKCGSFLPIKQQKKNVMAMHNWVRGLTVHVVF